MTTLTNHSLQRMGALMRYTRAMRDALILLSLGVVAVMLTVLFFWTTGLSSNRAQVADAPVGTMVPFEQVARGERSSVTWRANYLIATASEFSELWKLLGDGGNPPAIDFDTKQVIAVFAGKQAVAGYAIEVASVHDATSRQVAIVERNPGGSCLVAEKVTEPYQIVVVPKSALPLTRTERVETVSCLQ